MPQIHSVVSVLSVNILSHASCLFPAPAPVSLSYEKHKSNHVIPLLKILILFQGQNLNSLLMKFFIIMWSVYTTSTLSLTPLLLTPNYTNIILSVLIRLSFLYLWAFAHTIPFTENIHSVLLD